MFSSLALSHLFLTVTTRRDYSIFIQVQLFNLDSQISNAHLSQQHLQPNKCYLRQILCSVGRCWRRQDSINLMGSCHILQSHLLASSTLTIPRSCCLSRFCSLSRSLRLVGKCETRLIARVVTVVCKMALYQVY